MFSVFGMALTEEAEGDGWKAEEAIAGNQKALQGLREILLWPLIYSREANILEFRVNKFFTIYFFTKLPLFILYVTLVHPLEYIL